LRNVLYVFVDLLFICGRRIRAGANEVNQWLDALDQKCSLVFEVVLRASVDCC
jgi:hypothetical protein